MLATFTPPLPAEKSFRTMTWLHSQDHHATHLQKLELSGIQDLNMVTGSHIKAPHCHTAATCRAHRGSSCMCTYTCMHYTCRHVKTFGGKSVSKRGSSLKPCFQTPTSKPSRAAVLSSIGIPWEVVNALLPPNDSARYCPFPPTP